MDVRQGGLARLGEQSFTIDDASVAPNSRHVYDRNFKEYLKACEECHDDPFPVTELKFRGFILHKKDQGRLYATLRGYICAMAFYLNRNGLPDITKTVSFKMFKCGLRRLMTGDCPQNRKEPLTSDDISKFLGKHSGTREEDRQVVLLCSILYHGFLRISEALSLTVRDIVITDDMMSVTVRHSKTDQTGRGETVPIMDTGKPTNPMRFLPHNFADLEPETPLFSWSIDWFRRKLKRLLEECGYEEKFYSFHSFRRGGAYKASIAGVEDSVIKKFGRWESNHYVIYVHVQMDRAGREIGEILG
jgi:integrase